MTCRLLAEELVDKLQPALSNPLSGLAAGQRDQAQEVLAALLSTPLGAAMSDQLGGHTAARAAAAALAAPGPTPNVPPPALDGAALLRQEREEPSGPVLARILKYGGGHPPVPPVSPFALEPGSVLLRRLSLGAEDEARLLDRALQLQFAADHEAASEVVGWALEELVEDLPPEAFLQHTALLRAVLRLLEGRESGEPLTGLLLAFLQRLVERWAEAAERAANPRLQPNPGAANASIASQEGTYGTTVAVGGSYPPAPVSASEAAAEAAAEHGRELQSELCCATTAAHAVVVGALRFAGSGSRLGAVSAIVHAALPLLGNAGGATSPELRQRVRTCVALVADGVAAARALEPQDGNPGKR